MLRRHKLNVKEVPASTMTLLPPRPDVCQECAVKHDSSLPHNKDSMYYQIKFNMAHGRFPTWDDALAHCTEQVKEQWRAAMKEVMTKHATQESTPCPTR